MHLMPLAAEIQMNCMMEGEKIIAVDFVIKRGYDVELASSDIQGC